MSVPAAFAGVILIWSTTPIAIKWSGEGPGYLFGVTARMAIGLSVVLLLVALLRAELPWHPAARRTYASAGLGIFVAMLAVYWSAQHIPSGWISVVFGLTPIVTGLLASPWLGERAFGPGRLAGMLLGVGGLSLIFLRGAELGPMAAVGIAGVLLAVLVHAASAVAVKRIGAGLSALTVTAGGLLVATPLFVATYLVAGEGMPAAIPPRAGLSILYLGLAGSVIGFALYFYVLARLEATRVALLTLVTPVLALLIGHLLDGERITPAIWGGTGAILLGLALFELDGRLAGAGRPSERPREEQA